MAMTAAETGHLVLGTLHTTSAVKTIDRIIDALPVEEREQTKSFLAQSLLAVVTQVLVKTADGRGRKAICEVLVMTKAIAKLIQTDQTHQIPTPAADGARPRHAAARPGAAGGDQPARASIRTTPTATPPTSALFQKFVTDTSMLPKIDVTGSTPQAPAPLAHRLRRQRVPQIDAFLTEVLEKRGSDLHFIAGDPPRIRLYGDSAPLQPGAARGRVRQAGALRDHAQGGARALRGQGRRRLRLHARRAAAASASTSCAS